MNWRAGMLAVCVDDRTSFGSPIVRVKLREIYRVTGYDPTSSWHDLLGSDGGGLRLQGLEGRFAAARFRPLNDAEDDASLIARIQRCKPARKPVAA